MNPISAYFAPFPRTAKNGIISLLAGWILFLFSLHQFYLPGENSSRIVIIGVATCFIVIRGYNWGRLLCLLSNAMIVLLCLAFSLAYFFPPFVKLYGNAIALTASVLNLTLFSASTYFLWVRKTAAFYKSFHQPDAHDKGQNGGSA